MNEADLTTHLQEVSAALTSQTLSDSQLDTVAGGFMPSPLIGSDDERMTTLSIMTLGLGCAIVSIGQRAGDMMNFTKKYC
ncbi:MAG: hypothetical protein FD135_2061 [Comamonadaceae bacterium]|nr:MAG: hypothetical protein FD135_2061 [Comamonadaceae bacterium]